VAVLLLLSGEDDEPPPGSIEPTDVATEPAVSRTCSTTRLITLRAGREAAAAALAAAPVAAAAMTRRRRLAAALAVRFLGAARRADAFFFDALREEALREELRFFELFLLPPRFFEDFFFEDLLERFFAAMGLISFSKYRWGATLLDQVCALQREVTI
jgi:hypothetical protein